MIMVLLKFFYKCYQIKQQFECLIEFSNMKYFYSIFFFFWVNRNFKGIFGGFSGHQHPSSSFKCFLSFQSH